MTQEMASYYKERSNEYDHVYSTPRLIKDVEALKILTAGYFVGHKVYEVACGTGYWTQYAALKAASIYATDLNEETLAIARTRDYKCDDVTFATADAYAKNTEKPGYTGAIAGFWLSHVDLARMGEFIQALHAPLNKGARVLIFDEKTSAVREQQCPSSRTDKAGNRYEMRELENGEQFEIIKNFFDTASFQQHFGTYGHNFVFEELSECWVCRYEVS